MNANTPRAAALTVAMALLAAPAAGQVVETQDGSAIDANPRVGSGGLNVRRPASNDLSSQLYVTGQVTGLAGFRASANPAADTLRMNIPSAGLSGWRSRSVGLEDVRAGQPWRTRPYYERSRITLGASDILAGRNAPGTNVPISAVSAAGGIGRQLYVDALADYRAIEGTEMPAPLAGGMTGRDLSPPSPTSARYRSDAGLRLDRSGFAAGEPWRADASSATTLFGIPRGEDRQSLQRELYVQAHRDQFVSRRVESETNTESDAALAARVSGLPVGGADAPTPAGQAGRPEPGTDPFIDMLVKIRELRERRAPTTRPAGAEGLPERPGIDSPLVDLAGDGLVLRDLAGKGNDLYNREMARAQRRLRRNNYYQAASMFETAGMIDSRNPLAHLGQGLSLVGAGESLSGAHKIRRALRLFPPLMRTQVDLAKIMDVEALEAQLSVLEKRMQHAGGDTRAMLQFLAAYLYRNIGEDTKARTYAERLRQYEQADRLLRSYAEMLLTDEPTPSQTPPEDEQDAGPEDTAPPTP